MTKCNQSGDEGEKRDSTVDIEKYLPFQTLDILSANFIVQNVCHLIGRNLFSSGTFMNTVCELRNVF